MSVIPLALCSVDRPLATCASQIAVGRDLDVHDVENRHRAGQELLGMTSLQPAGQNSPEVIGSAANGPCHSVLPRLVAEHRDHPLATATVNTVIIRLYHDFSITARRHTSSKLCAEPLNRLRKRTNCSFKCLE